jgi:hypothetical protein
MWMLDKGKRGGGDTTQALSAFGPPFVTFLESRMFIFVKY